MHLHCKRCNHRWKTKHNTKPKVCGRCKSELWDKALSSSEISKELGNRCQALINQSDNIGYVTMAPQLLLTVIVALTEAEKAFSSGGMDFDSAMKAGSMLDCIRELVAAKVLPSHMYDVCWRLNEGYFRDSKCSSNSEVSECDIKNKIISNWGNSALSDFDFVGAEVVVPNLDRVDILAKDKSGNDVLVEIKKGSKDGYKQLRAYAIFYDSPRLINLSESSVKHRKVGIEYRTV